MSGSLDPGQGRFHTSTGAKSGPAEVMAALSQAWRKGLGVRVLMPVVEGHTVGGTNMPRVHTLS